VRSTRARSFFERIDDLAVLCGMSGARTDVGEAKLFQKRTDVSLAIVNAESLFDDPLKIDPPPANDAILLAVGSCLDDSSQFRKLISTQPWLNATCMDVVQTIRPLIIKTMNPVAQGLTIHPAYAGGVRPVHAIEHGGQRQKAPALVVILGFLGKPTQLGR
jgi:hypothetical protein